jgi:hypothetical protein
MHPKPIKGERRLEPRTEASAPLGILCTDREGKETRYQARLVDISLTGAKMKVPQKIPPCTSIAKSSRLAGEARCGTAVSTSKVTKSVWRFRAARAGRDCKEQIYWL